MKQRIINILQSKNGKKLLIIAAVLLVFGGLAPLFLHGKKKAPEAQLFGEHIHFAKDGFRVLVVSDDDPESEPYGRNTFQGVKAATLKINEKGGILGKQITLASVSSGIDSEEALKFIGEELKKTPVQLIIDASREDVSEGVIQAAETAKTPIILARDGSCRTGIGQPKGKISPYVYAMGLTRESEIEPFLTFLAEKRTKPESEFQVLFLSGDFSGDVETINLAKKTSESLAFKTNAFLQYDNRLEDYYRVAQEILSRLPDLVFIANRLKPATLFMEQATKLALNRDMALAGLHVFDEEWAPYYGKTIDDAYTVSRYISLIDNAENKELLSLLSKDSKKDKDGNPLPVKATASTFAGWSALIAFHQVSTAANSLDISALEKKFVELEFRLPNGTAFFDAKNHVLVQKMYALRIKSGKYEIIDALGDANHPGTEGCSQ